MYKTICTIPAGSQGRFFISAMKVAPKKTDWETVVFQKVLVCILAPRIKRAVSKGCSAWC